MPDVYVRRIHQILTGVGSAAQPNYRIWPAQTGAPAAGATVTSGAGAWGNVADVIAASAITVPFMVYGIMVTTVGGGAVQVFEIALSSNGPASGAAGPVTTPFLFQGRIDPTAVTVNLGALTLPEPVYCAANQRVAACLGGAAARSLLVSVLYVTDW